MQHNRPQIIIAGRFARLLSAVSIAFGMTAVAALADDRRPPMPTPPPTLHTPDVESIRPGLAPLLREGSQIQNVRGTLRDHSPSGTWRFTINRDDDAAAHAPRHEFIMLPNTHLSEMQQVAASMPDRSVTFQVTGEVFVYDGRNYLLVSFPPRVVSEQTPTPRSDIEEQDDDAAEEQPARPRSAAEIMRELDRDIGPVGRSPGMARDRDRQREQRSRAGDERLLPENTSVQLRRGRIGRDAGGAWQFVFDADATGRTDPPMTLMPCQLLHRIENYARRAGSNAPVLISGRVFVYNGRNFLLPTVFQIPRERTELMP